MTAQRDRGARYSLTALVVALCAAVGAASFSFAQQSNQGDAGVSVKDNVKRSVYLPLVRNFMPDILTTFDFADRDMVVGKRPSTNVPAQALYLMNSPFVRTAAEKTAARLLADESLDDDARIDRAYELALGRPATEPETAPR